MLTVQLPASRKKVIILKEISSFIFIVQSNVWYYLWEFLHVFCYNFCTHCIIYIGTLDQILG
jgi:hypothetical protein